MAAGEGHPDTLKCNYLAPLASFWFQKDFFFMPADNNADLSDVYSDSGSEREENSRNVVRWLESLPVNHQWYEAEEQIGSVEFSEGGIHDGISTIGDTDEPITPKSLRAVAPPLRAENIETKKVLKRRKYRKGTLHANSTTTELPERKKKSLSRESCAVSSTKSPTATTKITEIPRENREKKSPIATCRPNFRKPEIGRFLDAAMSIAIKKYKRNERTWESNGNNIMETNEPPTKKSKRSENIERKKKAK